MIKNLISIWFNSKYRLLINMFLLLSLLLTDSMCSFALAWFCIDIVVIILYQTKK
jgi:hypothetical protein